MKRGVQRIGVLGHVGNGNLGDEAIFTAVFQNLRARCPGAELCAFTSNPHDTRSRHGIVAFPIRRGTTGPANADPGHHSAAGSSWRNAVLSQARRVRPLIALLRGVRRLARVCLALPAEAAFLTGAFRRVARLDLLVVAGSGQLFDGFGGSWGFPYTLFKWAVLAKLSGARLVFLSVGAGPIRSPLSRFFIRRALALADYRSYRDSSSLALIERIRFSGPHTVIPDLAFGLSIPPRAATRSGSADRIVALNPMAYYARHYWPVHDQTIYTAYVEKIASFGLWLVRHGYTVTLFPGQVRADAPVIDDVVQLMASADPRSVERVVHKPIATVEELIDLVAAADLITATRYHSVLISALLSKPVVGISYQPKTTDLMTALGQADYVLDIEAFDVPSLIERFTSLEARSPEIGRELQRRTVDLRSVVAQQYEDALLAVRPNGPAFGRLAADHGPWRS